MTDTLRTGLAAKFSLTAVSRAAIGGLLGAALLAAGAPARAADDGVPLDTKIIRGLMESLGLREDGTSIDYSERAPLVIPPSHTLPPPERSDAALVNNPAWPVDPDVKRRKEEAAREQKESAVNSDLKLLHEGTALRPDELTPGPKSRKAVRQSADGSYTSSPNGYDSQLPPDKLGSKGSLFGNLFGPDKPDLGSFTREPPRTALTEPPAGYQTPSPGQPYGISKTKAPAPTSADYLINHPAGTQ
jgi:hypothetical protein